jgi:hypothetical protein
MRSGLCHSLLNALDFFHDNDLGDLGISPHFWHHKSKHYSHFCGPCVEAPANENLSGPQKELLEWHWKLGNGMNCIQTLMCERHYEEPDGKTSIFPAIIKPKYATTQNCVVLPCQLCLLARAGKHSPKVVRKQGLEDHEGAFMRAQYEVSNFISTDQFICMTTGGLPTGYG